MAHEIKLTRRVDFHETDLAGIVHFSNFFRYMEAAEHAFFRSVGLSIHETVPAAPGEALLGWPRVHAECDYKRPLKFEDEFEMHFKVLGVKNKSIVYEIVFRKGTEEIARGKVVAACVTKTADGKGMQAVPIPKRITDKIQAAP
jgi:YbgC/YbaW family acyl-CoA thioester hydrolase